MRLFQNFCIYPRYAARLRELAGKDADFDRQVRAFLEDRYWSPHVLMPVYDVDGEAFLTIGNDDFLQRAWAREHGLREKSTPWDIMLAQIEAHNTEVFYNLDPIRFDGRFAKKLPGCVKRRITWRAAPSPHSNFEGYDLVVSNFPLLLRDYDRRGFRTRFFSPAYDEVIESHSSASGRDIDIVFVGGYSRHHLSRVKILEAVASLAGEFVVQFYLDQSPLVRLAESPLGYLPPLSRLRRPEATKRVSLPGVFGRALYEVLGRAKIVLNAAVDMAGEERGNLRCFEASNCGALLLSDDGAYPQGFVDQRTMLTYRSPEEAASLARDCLRRGIDQFSDITTRGLEMLRSAYSREQQWTAFLRLCAN